MSARNYWANEGTLVHKILWQGGDVVFCFAKMESIFSLNPGFPRNRIN